MTSEQMAEIIDELLAVDTADGYIVKSEAIENVVTFATNEGEIFNVIIKKWST